MRTFLIAVVFLLALSLYKVYWIDPASESDALQVIQVSIAPEKLKALQAGAESGDRLDQYELGLLYASGADLVKQDFKQARELLQKAAMQGVPQAMYHLGEMYARGDGVEENYEEATVWFWLGSSLGDKYSEKRLRAINTRISSQALADAKVEVNRLWKQIPHDLKIERGSMH